MAAKLRALASKEGVFPLHVGAAGPCGSESTSCPGVHAGRAAGTRTALRRHLLPACELTLGPPSHTRPCGPPLLGLHGKQSLLSRFLGQASLSRDRRQQGGGLERSSLVHPGVPPQMLPGVWGTNARRVSPPFWRSGWIFVVPGPRQVQNDEFSVLDAKKEASRPTVAARSLPGSAPGPVRTVSSSPNEIKPRAHCRADALRPSLDHLES